MNQITCVSPIDGTVYATRPMATRDEVANRLDVARTAQKDWAARPLAERIALVEEGVARLDQVNADLVQELAWQMGRPTRYGGEMGGVRERTGYMAAIARRALAPEVMEDDAKFRRLIAREPVGLVLVIAPWNYPFLTAINTIVPALIAGNAVVLKHASQTPLAGERLAQAFAHLPDGVFTNLFLGHALTAELIAARSFGFVNFTGSVSGGQAIERAAAGSFTALGLELGGKDPGYVRPDANLDAAVDTLMDGAFYNSGQCCCGIERIYVAEPLFDAFVEKSVEWVSKLTLGNPLDAATTLGPMAARRFADTIRAQTAEAIAAGARPLIDPKLFAADTGETAYLAPQILVGVDHSMRVMTEESFGPVVGIMPVRDDEEAIALMNDSRYGLTASIWTEDPDVGQEIGARIETGTVFMNRADYLDPALTWTGVKDTGRGAALSHLGYLSVTRPKSYHLRRLDSA
ncbi:acyl-CoA reductase-like NAD-dependent aldehyde dehydrogenase [Amaricoccus macauensis]|uniref:Acyl-CoA reductase-like NAD-dependent aldehyde dehydrogenase n=1 Tax=Amaricoccus macauensis TaxID=57001 RepID=A0A840SFC6_9RHOB|nr:aldehyde dehydrogenase family protein [Amaricoccus macauensis]MBB5220547.1 acyl-CoA reductase-like NAD-dependent aldehyde dehydrogenase [Amaricoccus macauensis]